MSEPNPNPQPPSNSIRQRADSFRALIKEQAGVDFDYSMFALLHIDTVFSKFAEANRQNLEKPEFEKLRNDLVLQFGCFIGECLRETFFAEWDKDPKMGICLTRIANQDITAFPMSAAAACVQGEKGKVFAVTQAICAEAFKKVREKYYAQS